MTSRTTLSIEINKNGNVNFLSVANFLEALANEYDLFCQKKFSRLVTKERWLEISDIRIKNGAVRIELVDTLMEVNQAANVLPCFGKYLTEKTNGIIEDKKNAPDGMALENWENFRQLFAILNDDGDKSLNFRKTKPRGFWRSLFQRFHAVCVNRT